MYPVVDVMTNDRGMSLPSSGASLELETHDVALFDDEQL
jgi:hypothetical protein